MHRVKSWQLLATCVLAWGTTWFAVTFQIGHTSPEVSVALRFALAGGVVLAACAARGLALQFSVAGHARLALQGGFMYGVSYLCVYHAEQHIVSALVAVGYSASPLASGLGARLAFGAAMSRRFVAGGVLGVAGVALMFWPEVAKAAGSERAVLGVVFTVASVLLSTVGSLTASRNREHGLPFWPALGLGMLYGAATAAVAAVWQGQSFAPPAVASWWVSLLYLALVGSVLSFACFLTLQERIGPGPSGTVGVLTPLLALLVSMAFEGYVPTSLTYFGAALAVAGNLMILVKPRARWQPA